MVIININDPTNVKESFLIRDGVANKGKVSKEDEEGKDSS
jgi:hypothetical protein